MSDYGICKRVQLRSVLNLLRSTLAGGSNLIGSAVSLPFIMTQSIWPVKSKRLVRTIAWTTAWTDYIDLDGLFYVFRDLLSSVHAHVTAMVTKTFRNSKQCYCPNREHYLTGLALLGMCVCLNYSSIRL